MPCAAIALSASGLRFHAPAAQVARKHSCRGAAPIASPQQHWRRRAEESSAAAGGAVGSGSGSNLGIVIECDGGLIDAHVDAHRVAFNKAFSEIGHDCTNWNAVVFYDLMRLGDGTGEGVIAAYYSIRGWPVMLPSKERGAFLKKIHSIKVRILREMTAKGEVPLRAGVTEFLDDALAEGVKVSVVAATASVPEDMLVSSAMLNLGPNRAFQLKVITVGNGSGAAADGEGGDDAAASAGGGGSGEVDVPPGVSFEQQVQAAQAKAKGQAAQEFARVYNLQKAEGLGMAVDPKMMAAAERAGLLSPQFMTSLVGTMGTTVENTVLVAGGHTIMEAAKSAGMLTLGVPPSVAMRGGFSAADAIFDGYGAGGGLTWRKAKLILEKRNEKRR